MKADDGPGQDLRTVGRGRPTVTRGHIALPRRNGYEVHAAGDGDEGLVRFRELRPDVAVVDVALPGLDGVGPLQRIRTESQTPVLLTSVRTDPVDVVLGA